MPTKITTLTVNELGLASSANAAADAAAASAAEAAASAAAAEAAENSLLEWKGQWLTATAYAPSDLVYEAGNTYVCLVSHTSGTFSTDLTNNNWELFAAKGDTGPGSGDLLSTNNLSDVASAATSRANLGLGTLATQNGQLGMDFIESQDASSSSSLDFTGFDATKYDGYVFVISNLVPVSSSDIWLRTSTDGGSSFDSGASDYRWAVQTIEMSSSATSASLGATAAQLSLTGSAAISAISTSEGLSLTLRLNGPHIATTTFASWDGGFASSLGGYERVSGAGVRPALSDVDAVRFLFQSGNIASGTITMYGLRNA